MTCGPSTDRDDHTPTPWRRVTPEIEAEHGMPIWERECSWGELCRPPASPWKQFTTHDPADPEHPDPIAVR